MTSENRLRRSPPLSINRDFRQMASVFEPCVIRNVWIWPWAKGKHFIWTKIALPYWWAEVLSGHEIASCTLQELEKQRKVWYCRLESSLPAKGWTRAALSPLSGSLPGKCRFFWDQWVKGRRVTPVSHWMILSCENPGRISRLWWNRSIIREVPVNI